MIKLNEEIQRLERQLIKSITIPFDLLGLKQPSSRQIAIESKQQFECLVVKILKQFDQFNRWALQRMEFEYLLEGKPAWYKRMQYGREEAVRASIRASMQRKKC